MTIQAQIDAIYWYHEFDFPGGYQARDTSAGATNHRRIWQHIRRELDALEFAGKTVIDIGCWDGYWSFYAERRGASVLATDDVSQNWGGGRGFLLAKELLGSKVESNLHVSIYDLEALEQKFDIVLCLGIYYHLTDPLYAFCQLRHLCHENTIVVLEGDVTEGLRDNTSFFDFTDPGFPTFVPSIRQLDMFLRTAYLIPIHVSQMVPNEKLRLKHRVRNYVKSFGAERSRLPQPMNRAVTICRPFQGKNPMHPYKPPFGLAQYDSRFKQSNRTA